MYKRSLIIKCLFVVIILFTVGCGEDSTFNRIQCDMNHPFCIEHDDNDVAPQNTTPITEPEVIPNNTATINIENTSSSQFITNVTIVEDCKVEWGQGLNTTIGKLDNQSFAVESGINWQVRVTYSNLACDFAFNVNLVDGQLVSIPMYRRYNSCPASCL